MSRLGAWARRRGELLDDPASDDATVVAALADVARSNRLLGGTRAALAALRGFLPGASPAAPLSLLDVGTGVGDIPFAAARRASALGVRLHCLGVDRHPAAARAALRAGLPTVVAEATALPFRTGSVDLALTSQLLHHFEGRGAEAVLRELDRVARRGVVVSDLRRSLVAAAGFFLVSLMLRFHPVTRRDGVTSVLRGFTAREMTNLCLAAGVDATVRRHAGFRLTAAWRPGRGLQ